MCINGFLFLNGAAPLIWKSFLVCLAIIWIFCWTPFYLLFCKFLCLQFFYLMISSPWFLTQRFGYAQFIGCGYMAILCFICWVQDMVAVYFVACTLLLWNTVPLGVCVDVYSGDDFIYTMIDNISIGINPVEAWEILRRLGDMGESWDCSWRSIGWVWEAMAGSFLLTL